MKFSFLFILLLVSQNAFSFDNNAPEHVGITNQSTFSCTNSSLLAGPANLNRNYLLIQNTGATNAVTIKFGSTITGSEGIVLSAGSSFAPNPPIINSIYCKSASGTTLSIVEGIR